MATTVVFSGGPTDGRVLESVVSTALTAPGGRPDTVIAADAGLVACLHAGFEPDLVVGDMDSVPSEALERATASGAQIERHPVDKDAVDLELALDAALLDARTRGAAATPGPAVGVPDGGAPDGRIEGERVVVVGSAEGRLDHLVASMALLGAQRYADLAVEAWFGGQLVVPVRGRRLLRAPVGTTVSLLALHGAGSRVSTGGLRWRMDSGVIPPGSSLGVSNTFADSEAWVDVEGPPVTVVLPDLLEQSARTGGFPRAGTAGSGPDSDPRPPGG